MVFCEKQLIENKSDSVKLKKTRNTNLKFNCTIKGAVIFNFKNVVIELHSTATEFMSEAFKFEKTKKAWDI